MKHIIPKIKDWFPELVGLTRMHIVKKTPSHYLGYVLDSKVPVVMITGIFNRWAFYKPLLDQISLKGHPVYVVHTLGDNIKDIPSSAKIVKDFIEKNNLANVVLVSHSKGGLIGKYLLQHLNSENRVMKLIAIAAPFSGSNLVKLLPLKRINEFSPDSEIIKELNSYTKVNKKIISIIPSFDVMIRHDKGSYLEGAKNINVKAGGHNRVANNNEAISVVINELEDISRQLGKPSSA